MMDISFWCILWKRMESNDGSIGGNFFLGGEGYSCMHVKFVTWERWWIKLCTECVQFNWIFLVISHFCIFHNNIYIYIFSFLRLCIWKNLLFSKFLGRETARYLPPPPRRKILPKGGLLNERDIRVIEIF